MTTGQGEIILKLEEQKAPNTVKNFVGLATGTMAWTDPRSRQQVNRPFYDGLDVPPGDPGFMIQATPCSVRHRRPGPLRSTSSTVRSATTAPACSMANAGPGTNGSQFFITEGPTPYLNDLHSVLRLRREGHGRRQPHRAASRAPATCPATPPRRPSSAEFFRPPTTPA
ncbi:MAG: peptidylprolyl isomerase [Polyangiales bacterium]